jgi:hypothetical protein
MAQLFSLVWRPAGLQASVPIPALRGAVIAFASLALFGCHGDEASPIPSPSPTPPIARPAGDISLRAVDVLNAEPIPGAVVDLGDMAQVVTDAHGVARIVSEGSAVRLIRVNAPGYFERRTGLRLSPMSDISVSLIPSFFDLASFDVAFRRAGLMVRWVTNPSLQLHTSVFNGISGVQRSTGGALSPQDLGCIETNLEAALADMTGGALTFASTEVLPVLPQFTVQPPHVSGAITFKITLNEPTDSGATVNTDASVSSGGVTLIAGSTTTYCTSPDRDKVRRELGRALGLDFLTRPSVMNPAGTFTEFDRQAVTIQYRRPAGNRSPDTDPDGFTVN